MLLAEGAVDLAAEPELELYDMAALDVIVREAGGRFTGLDGRDGPHSGNALASNGMLHETVLGFLGAVGEDRAAREGQLDPDLEPGQAEGRSGTVFDLTSRRRPEVPPT
jgi:histidinol-phosphatase